MPFDALLFNSVVLKLHQRRGVLRDDHGRFLPGTKGSTLLGRIGGLKGGPACTASMTKEQLTARARKGAAAALAAVSPEQRREICRIAGHASQAARPRQLRVELSRKGGFAAAAKMTPEQRMERSKRAIAALRAKRVANG